MAHKFSDISTDYKAIFFDAFGVLKSSQGVLPGVDQTLKRLKQERRSIWVVTNDASKSPERMAEAYLDQDGTPLIPESCFVSSGMLASAYLSSQVEYGRVGYLGKPGSAHYIEIAGLIPVPISECKADDKLVAIVLLDDEGFDWFKDINTTLNLIRRVDAPVIIANNDATYPVDDQEIAFAVGSLGEMIENIVERTFVRFGKPGEEIFDYAFRKASEADPDLKLKDVLFVGDTLRTDIVGATQFGLDTALVLSGNTLAEHVDQQIEKTGITPTFICDSITT